MRMGIYIDMEMPESCDDCRLNNGISCYAVPEYTEDGVVGRTEDRPDWCPLVPVPPHGRLIDADALVADLRRQCKEVFKTDAVSPDDFWIIRDQAYNERLWTTWCESLFAYLKTAPTIIPAEEEKT